MQSQDSVKKNNIDVREKNIGMDTCLPLKGINVLELASVLAGPSIGMFLAELGADVIKVENLVTNGDVTRKWKLPAEDPSGDISGYFSSVNWGKKSVAIDIATCEGLGLVHRLTRECDIILASYKPGDAEKLKVDFSTLSSLNPGIIYGHITGYGLQNQRAGFDAIIQAEAGFTYMNGDAGGPPVKMPVALMDVLAAHHLKEAILLALVRKEREGKGCYLEASLYRAGISSLINQATNWLVGNTIPQRLGSDHPNIVPYGTIFSTADNRNIVLAIGTEKQYRELCRLLGREDLADDKRYNTNYNRVINRESLKIELQELIGQYDRDEILGMLEDNKIPAGGVFNMKEVFETPEGSDMIISASRGETVIRGVSTIAFREEGKAVNRDFLPPPRYGEHTIEILKDRAGLNEAELKRLIEQKVIYAGN